MTSARTAKPHVHSVTEITRSVRELVEGVIGEVWVEGEIGNLRRQASGHQYFTLKDDRCQLPCVLFHRPGLRHATIPLSDGMLIHARGMMTVYEARGQYQLNVSLVQAAGEGLLAAKFEALKRKLAADGLFEMARKRQLPRFPRRIGIVTSPTGAAVRDMIQILHRRAPWIPLLIAPVRVQGSGAAAEIAAAVAAFNDGTLPPVDVIVVARGGGSAEDLWEFNEEIVARAIYASAVPVVSAIGHEIDFSIADFVADLRAPTPSAAAELIAPDSAELSRRLEHLSGALGRRVRETLQQERRKLELLSRSSLFREPRLRLNALAQDLDTTAEALSEAAHGALATLQQRLETRKGALRQFRPDQLLAMSRHQLDGLSGRLSHQLEAHLQQRRHELERLQTMLRLLGPQATLARGYSITRLENGEIVRSAHGIPAGTRLQTQLPDGVVESQTTPASAE